MSRYRRLKIEGGAFFYTLALATAETICWSASVNERVGMALRAFAHRTLAIIGRAGFLDASVV
jgi:hypothetical protein